MSSDNSTAAKVKQAARAIKSRLIYILAFVLIATGITALVSIASPTVYKASFLVETTILSESQVNTLIENVNAILSSEREQAGSDYTVDMINGVDKVGISPVRVTDNKIASFKVNMFYFNPELTADMVDAILLYLNKNPYVAEKVALKRTQKEQLLKEIASRTKQMKENNEESSLNAGDKSINLFAYQRNEEYVRLKDQQFELERELNELEGFTLIDTALIPTKPHGPLVGMNIAIAFMLSLLVAVSVVIILEN